MQRLTADIVSLGSWWGKEEQTMSIYIPPMTGTEVSHNSGIPVSEDNPASGVQVDGNGNISPALSGL